MTDLKKAIEATRMRNLTRAKVNYRLARQLGFSSYEAVIVAQRSQKNIRKLAEDRNNGTDKVSKT